MMADRIDIEEKTEALAEVEIEVLTTKRKRHGETTR